MSKRRDMSKEQHKALKQLERELKKEMRVQDKIYKKEEKAIKAGYSTVKGYDMSRKDWSVRKIELKHKVENWAQSKGHSTVGGAVRDAAVPLAVGAAGSAMKVDPSTKGNIVDSAKPVGRAWGDMYDMKHPEKRITAEKQLSETPTNDKGHRYDNAHPEEHIDLAKHGRVAPKVPESHVYHMDESKSKNELYGVEMPEKSEQTKSETKTQEKDNNSHTR